MVETVQLDAIPSLMPLYARAAVTAVVPGGGDGLPQTELLVSDLHVDRGELAAYDRVCGFRVRDVVPVTYPHVVAFPLSVRLMADRRFPFALPGLVHVANRITQHRPLRADDVWTVRVATRDLRPHPKGRQFDVVASVEVADSIVWESASTYLHRGSAGSAEAPPDEVAIRPSELPQVAVWRLASDVGRRYARVSGDRNPIHLHPLTARLFGFPRTIAHGMWTAARALSALEPRLPGSGTFEVRFRKPLLLPATAVLRADVADGRSRLAVTDRTGDHTHLVGLVTG